MKSFFIVILISIFFISCKKELKFFTPGEIWPDNNGVHINAHGGGLLFHKNVYYWYGEHKIEGDAGNRAMVGVHCYSSKNLYDWHDEGIVLSVEDDTTSLIVKGCIIERPKVIFNEKTGKFVMWFHHELKSMGYKAAKTGVAVADSPIGKFEYKGSVNPNAGEWPVNFSERQKAVAFPDTLKDWSDEWLKAVANGLFICRDFEKGQMARDMALFVDDDGKAYHIHASEENLTLHISELNDKYTGFTGRYAAVMPAGHNEAPAIFKKDGKYYLITSGCTGWAPNAARSFVADNILGPWTSLGNPCRGTIEQTEKTFGGQSTYAFENPEKPGSFVLMLDQWRPRNAIDGRYVWLPIEFEQDRPTIKWADKWSLN